MGECSTKQFRLGSCLRVCLHTPVSPNMRYVCTATLHPGRRYQMEAMTISRILLRAENRRGRFFHLRPQAFHGADEIFTTPYFHPVDTPLGIEKFWIFCEIAFSAQRLSFPNICDVPFREALVHFFPAELGISPAVGDAAHIHHTCDTVATQQVQEFLLAVVAVTYRPKRVLQTRPPMRVAAISHPR